MLFRSKKYQLFILFTLLLAAFFVVNIKPASAYFDPAVTYSKTTSGQLSADEWNNLQVDFMHAWGNTTAVGGIGIGIAPQGTDFNGLVASSTIKANGGFLGSLAATDIAMGDFGLHYSGGGGTWGFPTGRLGVSYSAGQITSGTATFAVNGNVGIGTVSPNSARLQLTGSGTFDSIFRLTNTGTNGGDYFMGVTNSGWDAGGNKLIFGVGTPSSANTKMVMDANGNLGIGTVSPLAKLDVSGTNSAMTFRTVSPSGQIQFYNWSDGKNYIESTNAANNASQLLYFTGYGGGAGTFSFSGNVGIGTTSPANLLHLYTTSGGDKGLSITNTGTGAGDDPAVALYNSTSNYATLFLANANNVYAPSSAGFYTNYSNGFTIFAPKFVFTRTTTAAADFVVNNGNVGIGTTSPLSTLDVNGLIKMRNVTITQPEDVITKGYLDSSLSSTTASIVTQIATSSLWQGSLAGAIYNNNSGNVGIGTTNPAQSLNVVSGISEIRVGSGASSLTPTLSVINNNATGKAAGLFAGTTYSGFDFSTDNGGYFVIGGIAKSAFPNNTVAVGDTAFLTIGNTGNVGIGTTTPAYKLDINGDARTSGDAYFDKATFIKDDYSANGVDSWWGWYAWEKEFQFNKRTSGNSFTQNIWTANWDTGNLNLVPNGGLVGVGSSTPSALLSVGNNLSLTDLGTIYGATSTRHIDLTGILPDSVAVVAGIHSTAGELKIDGTGNSYVMGNLGIGTTAPTSGNKLEVNGAIVGASGVYSDINRHAGFNTPNANDLSFRAGNADGVMYIKSGGNVGIGTTNPTLGKLQIEGAAGSTLLSLNNTAANWGMSIDSNTIPNFYIGSVYNSIYAMNNYFWRANWNTAGVAHNTFQNPSTAVSGLTVMEIKQHFTGDTGDYLHITSNGGASGNLLTVDKAGNVGIGTTGPIAKLHSVITSNGAGLLLENAAGSGSYVDLAASPYPSSAWTVAAPGAIRFTDVGNYSSNIDFMTKSSSSNGALSSKMTILNGGNVGIGSTTPNFKFVVNGDASFSGYQIHNVGAPATGTDVANRNYVDSVIAPAATTTVGLQSGFWTTGAGSSIYNNNTGNVGIGTTAPGSLFTVQKNTAGGRGGEISIVNYAANTVGNEAALNFGLESSTYDADNGNAQIKARLNGVSGASTDMIFSLWSGGGFYEYMRILSTGNVGIGTTTPGSLLTVGNNLGLTTGGTIYGATSTRYLDLSGVLGDSLAVPNDIHSTAGELKIDGTGNSYLMGNLGVGTTNPMGKLDVNGQTLIGFGDRTQQSTFPLYISDSSNLGWKVADSAGVAKFELYAGAAGINQMRLLGGVKLIGYNQDLTLGTTNNTSALTIQNNASGNVGIGTAAPGTLLDVGNSASTATQYIRVNGASAYQTGIQIASAGSSKWYIYRPANSNDLRIYDTADRVTFGYGSGNVGIGTTAPTLPLNVFGHIGGSVAAFDSGASVGQILIKATPGSAYIGVDSGPIAYFGTHSGSNTSNLIINNSGSVGIGTATPTQKLEVSGGNIFINDAVIGSSTPHAAITKAYLDSALDAVTANNLWGGSLTGNIYNYNSGNVGIGTNTAAYKLDINGTFRATASSSSILLDDDGDVMIGI